MNQLSKSIFLSGYTILALLGAVIGVDQFIHGYTIAALGLLMIALPFVYFISALFLFDIARTSANLSIGSWIVGIGVFVLGYAFYLKSAESMAAVGFLLALCWLLYIKWYSVFQDRRSPLLETGKPLPLMSFENDKGEVVLSKSLLGHKSIFMFYRGNWCPLCMTQIKELAAAYKTLQSRDIQTILISPQPHRYTRKLAKKYDLDFHFLVDKDNAVAKQLNIFSKNGLPAGMQILGYDSDTVMPTVILTDEKGVIIHSDLTSNYRVRPEPEELLIYFN